MSFVNIFFIALSLAMDTLAVSIVIGVSLEVFRYRKAFKAAVFFAGFQALMPALGWTSGLRLSGFMEGFDHWVVFVLLLVVGSKMIFESLKNEQCSIKDDPLCISSILVLAFATSLDAFAVGIGFALLDMKIILPVIVIGLVTLGVSFTGTIMGAKIGILKGKRLEIIGGIVLILIGLRVVFDHYFL